MIIPTVSAVSREVLMAVPQQQREAAYMLGATRWEMFRLAMFPYAKTGLIGASILGLGRAVGETIAVTMLIGNATGINAIPESLFGPVLFKERSIKCSFFLRVQLLIAPSLTLSMRVTSTCATMLMHIAIPKSTNPTPIIAGRCNEAGEASTNSLAIMLDIVCPGPKSDSGMAFIPVAFPISIVTAIVSPTARPNPRMDAPISPVFAYGFSRARH